MRRDLQWSSLGMQLEDGGPIWTDYSKRKWTTYGVIAAQRRERGQVWLVIAGLSAPATYAASALVDSLTSDLPAAAPAGEKSGVLWAVVKAEVEECDVVSGDNRTLIDYSFLRPPSVWVPRQRSD